MLNLARVAVCSLAASLGACAIAPIAVPPELAQADRLDITGMGFSERGRLAVGASSGTFYRHSLENRRRVRYLEAQPSFRDQLIEAWATNDNDQAGPTDAFSMMARKPQEQLARVFAEVQSILNGPSIQARCLECEAAAPTRAPSHDRTLLALLRSWLSA